MFLINLFKKVIFDQPETTVKIPEDKRCPKLISREECTAVQGVVSSFLTTQDFINVSKASQGSRALFAPTRPINKLQNLLQAVVYGDLKEAEKIINTDPTLLLKSGTVTDDSGRIHSNRTAFQLALGACDYNVKDRMGKIVVRGMVEKLEMLFKKLPGKTDEEIREIMRDQYTGQFPEDYKALEAERVSEDLAALHRITDVIADLKDENDCTVVSELEDKIHQIIHKAESKGAGVLRKLVKDMLKAASKDLFDNAFEAFRCYLTDSKLLTPDAVNIHLLKALYQFRWHLEPKGHQTTGKHFNHQLLVDAAELYEKNYVTFGNHWNCPKNVFCWQKVFGGVERHVPACDAQSMSYGLWDLYHHGRESPRSPAFHFGGGKYDPLIESSDWGVGHNCAIATWPKPCRTWVGGGLSNLSRVLKSYIEQKQHREILSSTLETETSHLSARPG